MNKYEYSLKLKKYLIGTNIFLSILLICLLVFGISFLPSVSLTQLENLRQYMMFDITESPKNTYVALAEEVGSGSLGQSASRISDPKIGSEIDSFVSYPPSVAVIVTHLGLNAVQTARAVELPKEVALGFSPYTNTLKPLLRKAIEDGHEAYLSLLIDHGYEHIYNLNSTVSLEKNIDKLSSILSSHAEYNGLYLNNLSSSRKVENLIAKVAEELLSKKLILITKNLPQIYQGTNAGIVSASIVIEHEIDESEIKKKLETLTSLVKEHKKALLYVHGYVAAIDCLAEWIESLKAAGIELVPVSVLSARYR
jgi:polysaccharide deacetylase 2 family uncharacterized protein YibQ